MYDRDKSGDSSGGVGTGQCSRDDEATGRRVIGRGEEDIGAISGAGSVAHVSKMNRINNSVRI